MVWLLSILPCHTKPQPAFLLQCLLRSGLPLYVLHPRLDPLTCSDAVQPFKELSPLQLNVSVLFDSTSAAFKACNAARTSKNVTNMTKDTKDQHVSIPM